MLVRLSTISAKPGFRYTDIGGTHRVASEQPTGVTLSSANKR
jgi:hypothetical protein